MRIRHLELLRCLDCGGELDAVREGAAPPDHETITLGMIACTGCRRRYPVVHGVGIFFGLDQYADFLTAIEKAACRQIGFSFPDSTGTAVDPTLLKVTQNWSYEWNEVYNFSRVDLESDGFFGLEKFREFIRIAPEEYAGKTVVVWCGAKGREAYHISKSKPALIIVNEIGDEIHGIPSLMSPNQDILLVRCDMLHNPFRPGIADISICDHALQHISDHNLGFRKLAEVLRPGGLAAICAYSREHNFVMTHGVEPMKAILHAFPLKVQRLAALPPAIALFLLIRLLYMPAKALIPGLARRVLPLYDHMIFWSKDSIKFLWLTCFDLMHAPISYHFRKDEVLQMAADSALSVEKLENTHGTTWSLVARKG